MKFAIQNITFEERSKINDLFDAPYYSVQFDSSPSASSPVVITAFGSDKSTVQGQLKVSCSDFSSDFNPAGFPSSRFALPRDAFLLGITLCLVDGEPYWFLGAALDIKGTDDRQYFGVISTSFATDETFEEQPKVTIVNDIDNNITLLAPVLDAQAMFQPDDED